MRNVRCFITYREHLNNQLVIGKSINLLDQNRSFFHHD